MKTGTGGERAAVLWSGGKDSAMALHEARQRGLDVRCLATFAPPAARFLAHPLPFLRLQARALDLPHRVLTVGADAAADYERGLRSLREDLGIACVVTGDIAEVEGNPNWIRERARPAGVAVHTPLWGRHREALLRQLVGQGFRARISCIRAGALGEEWLGRELDGPAIEALLAIGACSGLDLCGEGGEYHTLVTHGPAFRRRIGLRAWSKGASGGFVYMKMAGLELL